MKLLTILPLLLIVMVLNAVLFMLAWNVSMPHLFKLPDVSLLQSIGVVIVAHTLLKGGFVNADFKSN